MSRKTSRRSGKVLIVAIKGKTRNIITEHEKRWYVVTQRSSWGGALRDDTKNGCVADYDTCWHNWFESIISDLLNVEPNYRCLYHRIHLYWINLHCTPSSFFSFFFHREKCLTWSKCWKQHLTFLIFKNTCRKKMNENADEPKEIFHMKYVH